MSEKVSREEVLDLLSRGKISIDEAVNLLEGSAQEEEPVPAGEPLYKPEMEEGYGGEEVLKIKVSEETAFADQMDFDELPAAPKGNGNGHTLRWLRVQVTDSKTGKRKVSVNVPFAMVKFGLGVAKVFSPEMKGVDLDEVSKMFDSAEAGLLVDVQDEESNEHVKIFFE
jgi:hypothetical protein